MIQFRLLVLLVLSGQTSGFLLSRRRRAPQPPPVDCVLSSWKVIEECSHDCGPNGYEKQERTIVEEGRNGGKSCSDYELTRKVECNRVCYNEATMRGGECVCTSGWMGDCCGQDVDECSIGAGPCEQICTNEPGTFKCSCNENYTLDVDDSSCKDLAECQQDPKPCAHRCKEITGGGYECYCDEGYELDQTDQSSCNDIDECESSNDCQFTCVNTPGSYECNCPSGYLKNADKKTCTDVDECADGTAGCDQGCENTQGGFTCTCNAGYMINGQSCDDIDECAALGATLCEQLCINVAGSYECTCVPPYTLNTDRRTCTSPTTAPPNITERQTTERESESEPTEPSETVPSPGTDPVKSDTTPPCNSTDAGACEEAEEEAAKQNNRSSDNDTMYNWIIAALIFICAILVLALGVVCIRKGYHRFYPPKPPPIATIPRYNNRAFNNQFEADDEPVIYEDLADFAHIGSPDYMAMDHDEHGKLSMADPPPAGQQGPQFAENDYQMANPADGGGAAEPLLEHTYEVPTPSAPAAGPRESVYVDASPVKEPSALAEYVDPSDHYSYSKDPQPALEPEDMDDEVRFEEDEYENNPPVYDNI